MFLTGPQPLIDRPTLILVLYAGIDVGLIGAFDFDILHWVTGKWLPVAQCVIGLASVWQVLRQRWW